MIQMSRGRRQISALATIAACVAFLAAACTGSAPPPPSGNPVAGPVPQVVPTDSGQPSPTPPPGGPAGSASPAASHSPTPTSPVPSSPQAVTPVPSCATAGLRGSFGAASGAAGTLYYPVQFTNTSGLACTLFGYPGVSVVTGPAGSQVGAAAVRIPTFSPVLVTLAPDDTVHASLQMPNPGLLSPAVCVPKTVHWLRVYPPGQFSPLYISVPSAANPVQICTGKHLGNTIPLGVFVVMLGSTGT